MGVAKAVSNILNLSSFSSKPGLFSVELIVVMLQLMKVERDRHSIKISNQGVFAVFICNGNSQSYNLRNKVSAQ